MQYTMWIKQEIYDFFLITIFTRYNKHTYPKQTTSVPYTVKLLHLQSLIYVKWPLRNDHEEKIDSIYHNVFP